jgi:tetratricopeptide (TPR) repeat protein
VVEDPAKPAKCMISPAWQKLLEKSHAQSPNWHSALQLGLMAVAAKEYDKANAYLSESIYLKGNPVAYYGLAVLANQEDRATDCVNFCKALLACMEPDNSVQRDVARLYADAKAYNELIAMLKNSPYLARDGRLRLYMAQALSALNRPEEAEEQLVGNGGIVVDDLREGELMLSELYYQIQEQKAKNAGLPYDEKAVVLPDFLNFKLLADD